MKLKFNNDSMSSYRNLDENLLPTLELFSSEIKKLVDFGLKILDWDTAIPGRTDEHMPPALFLRNFVEKIDAVSILIQHSSIDPSKVLLRTALENMFSLEYLLEKDTEKRSLAFLVWNSIMQNKWAEKADGKSQAHKQLVSEFRKDKVLGDHTPLIHPNVDEIKDIGARLLAHEKYAPAYEEYKRTQKERKVNNPDWFTLYGGAESIIELSKRLKLGAHYEILYRALSQSVHGNDIIQEKFITEDGLTYLAQIRFPKALQDVTQMCFNFAIATYKLYIDKRIPDRTKEYQEWYEVVGPFNLRLSSETFVTFVEG